MLPWHGQKLLRTLSVDAGVVHRCPQVKAQNHVIIKRSFICLFTGEKERCSDGPDGETPESLQLTTDYQRTSRGNGETAAYMPWTRAGNIQIWRKGKWYAIEDQSKYLALSTHTHTDRQTRVCTHTYTHANKAKRLVSLENVKSSGCWRICFCQI